MFGTAVPVIASNGQRTCKLSNKMDDQTERIVDWLTATLD